MCHTFYMQVWITFFDFTITTGLCKHKHKGAGDESRTYICILIPYACTICCKHLVESNIIIAGHTMAARNKKASMYLARYLSFVYLCDHALIRNFDNLKVEGQIIFCPAMWRSQWLITFPKGWATMIVSLPMDGQWCPAIFRPAPILCSLHAKS